ncbi:MAG: ATP cone domain-containing protein [Patescibacteria group bacterium]|nr:ATP cone domain-containing protein [Patescibacteria group bacterium]
MIKEVFKKGGQKEPFNLNKIKKSLISVVEKTDLPQAEKNEIVEKVTERVLKFLEDKKEAFTAEIEAEILLELEKLAPSAVQIWREYRYQKYLSRKQ